MASHAEGPSAGSALPPTLSSAKEPHGQQASPGAASHPLEWEEEAASPSSDLASARATPSPVPTGRGGGGGGGEGSPNPGMALQLLQLQCVLEAKDREMSCLRQQISSDQVCPCSGHAWPCVARTTFPWGVCTACTLTSMRAMRMGACREACSICMPCVVAACHTCSSQANQVVGHAATITGLPLPRPPHPPPPAAGRPFRRPSARWGSCGRRGPGWRRSWPKRGRRRLPCVQGPGQGKQVGNGGGQGVRDGEGVQLKGRGG